MALHHDTASKANAHEVLLNDPEFLRQLVEIALQRFLDAEISEHLQAAPHEWSDARLGYRNGYRSRQLKTRVGTIELAVPMDRDGTFRSELFERYQRSEKAFVAGLMQMSRGSVYPEGAGRDGSFVWDGLLEVHCVELGEDSGCGSRGVALTIIGECERVHCQ